MDKGKALTPIAPSHECITIRLVLLYREDKIGILSDFLQQMMGPLERYGKVGVKGKFEYGGKYGHIGAYSS